MSGYRAATGKRAPTVSEAKLKKILELNIRLRDQLEIPRIPVSEASSSLIKYCRATPDKLVPSIWGPVDKRNDPYAPAKGGCGCCTIM